ncbi:MAG: hypothetical protein DHS20C14_20680 [Phycisphaeraceae bacterium]|nr:MAG: hypothetical protein DHS20C14_20680 [Phycisphaeraceae bacterium]
MTGSTRRIDRVSVLVGGAITVVFGVLLARVGQLQLAPGEELARHVQARESGRSLAAPRGALLDRRGRPLAMTRFAYQTVVDPTALPDPPDEAVVQLAGVLGMNPGELGGELIGRLIENDERRETRAGMGLDAVKEVKQESVLSLVRRKVGLAPEPTPDEILGVLVEVDEETPRPPTLIRYTPVGETIELETADAVRSLRIPGVWVERRPVREYPGGDAVAAIVGKVGFADRSIDLAGLVGAERALDGALSGTGGQLRYVRDALGRPLWVERGDWVEPAAGASARLSIDVEVQRIAVEELTRGVEDADAAGGRIVVLDPATGEILAMADIYREIPNLAEFPWLVRDAEHDTEKAKAWLAVNGELAEDPRDRPRYRFLRPDPGREIHPSLGRNRCVEDIYEPGSTFKSLVWARAYELGVLPADDVVETGGKYWRTPYGRRITDVYPKDHLSWDEVLLHSSNIGMAQLAERLTHEQMREVVTRFGFGRSTGTGLPGETAGLVTSKARWNKYTQTSVATGYEVGVTPVQMARAFCAFARSGQMGGTLPELRLTAVGEDGRGGVVGGPVVLERVLQPETAEHVRTVMAGVAENMDSRMTRRFEDEPEPSYTMFGKSGTSEVSISTPPDCKRPRGFNGYLKNQHQSSFLAGAPLENPRLVVLAVIDDPGPTQVRNREHYGSWVAGPVVRRVMERGLRYLGVPADVRDDEDAAAVASARD